MVWSWVSWLLALRGDFFNCYLISSTIVMRLNMEILEYEREIGSFLYCTWQLSVFFFFLLRITTIVIGSGAIGFWKWVNGVLFLILNFKFFFFYRISDGVHWCHCIVYMVFFNFIFILLLFFQNFINRNRKCNT